jgi:hypothetical protein
MLVPLEVNAVPEPAATALLAIAATVFGTRRRRRKFGAVAA